jgi:putative toxin-antitoxin system antitoxin component (TIGR02293 family)
MAASLPSVPKFEIPPGTLRLLGGEAACIGDAWPAPRFRYQAVQALAAFLGRSDLSLMALLQVNERTALRRKEGGELSAEESDRLARLARITRTAIESLGDEQRAREWMTRENRALRGQPPLHLAVTDAGAELVADELGRIEYGLLY